MNRWRPRRNHYTHAREQNFCANFVPLAYKKRPYLGICGNSEDQLFNTGGEFQHLTVLKMLHIVFRCGAYLIIENTQTVSTWVSFLNVYHKVRHEKLFPTRAYYENGGHRPLGRRLKLPFPTHLHGVSSSLPGRGN